MTMKRRTLFMLVVLTQILGLASSIEPITTFAGAVIGVLASSAPYLGYCFFFECCNDARWVKHHHATNLKADLHERVYGQHLALDTLPATIRGHFTHPPKKSLVLSFQGTSGTGKNLVANLVADNIYKKGMYSKFLHTLSGTKDFSGHEKVDDYKDQLQRWIIGNVSACEKQLFIFDEVDKMPPGLLDALKPFVDHYETLEGVDYRKAIYIFLSNAGGKMIAKYTHGWHQTAEPREDIKLKDLQQSMVTSAFHDTGGLKGSTLIESNLISHFVPFLPLEMIHVRNCTKDSLRSKNFTAATSGNFTAYTEVVEEVMAHLVYGPDENPVFSQSGCKLIDQKVNLVLQLYLEMEMENKEKEKEKKKSGAN